MHLNTFIISIKVLQFEELEDLGRELHAVLRSTADFSDQWLLILGLLYEHVRDPDDEVLRATPEKCPEGCLAAVDISIGCRSEQTGRVTGAKYPGNDSASTIFEFHFRVQEVMQAQNRIQSLIAPLLNYCDVLMELKIEGRLVILDLVLQSIDSVPVPALREMVSVLVDALFDHGHDSILEIPEARIGARIELAKDLKGGVAIRFLCSHDE